MAKAFSAAFYKSKPWRAAREQCLHDSMYTCADCGGRATEVHHKNPLTPENINDPVIALGLDNLEALCWGCHDKRTKQCADVAEGYRFDENGYVVKA